MLKSKNCKEFFCNRSAKHCTRRRRERRAQARHRAVGWQLHQESLESRIALSINSYTTQGGLDLYTGEYRAGTFDGAVVKGYSGKDQHFFLVHFHGPEDAIQLDMPNPEFQDYRWIMPDTFSLEWLPPMKRAMYRQVFADLLWIKL